MGMVRATRVPRRVEAPPTSTETASVCAATATLSILQSSRTKQALTPEVSLKVSARVRVQ